MTFNGDSITYFSLPNNTVRPRGTRPRGTRTSLVHDFKKGSKIFEISNFGTQTSLGHNFENFDTSSNINECQTD